MQIYITNKGGQQHGPYDEEQLTQHLQTGEISYDDLAWVEGMSNWQPLSTICTPPAGAPPLPAAFQNDAGAKQEGSLKLYSPFQVCWGTFIGGPIAGSFLHASNLRSLGRPSEAKKWLVWAVVATLALFGICAVLPDGNSRDVNRVIPLLCAGAMYFLLRRKYEAEFKKQIENNGTKKSNWKVFGISLGVAVITLIVAIPLILFFDSSDTDNNSKAALPIEMTVEKEQQAMGKTDSSSQQKATPATEAKTEPTRQQVDNTSSLPQNSTVISNPKQKDITEDARSYNDLTKVCSPKVVTMVQTFEEGKYYSFPLMNIADANNKLMLVYYTQTSYSGGTKSEDQKLCGILTFPNENALSNANLEEGTPVRAVGKFTGFRNIPMNDGATKRLPVFECPGIEIRGTYFKTK